VSPKVGWAVYVRAYMYVYAYGYVYICMYIYANASICIHVDAWVCVCVYIYICVCVRMLVYIYMRKVNVCMYVNICMRVYAYMFACTCMGMYVYVCGHMSMYVRGPITPCGLEAGGTVFIRVRTSNLTGTLRHPTGWLIFNLTVLTGDIIFLSQCRLLWYTSTSGTLMHPNLAHVLLTINQQQERESNKLAFCFSLTTSTLVPNPITTDSYFFNSERTRIEHLHKGHLRHGHQQLVQTSH